MDKEKQRPPEVVKYMEADKAEKEAKKQKDKLKPAVIDYAVTAEDEEVKWSERKQTKMHEDKILEWVRSEYPDLVEQLTKEALDLEAFEKAVKAGKVKIDLLPDHCYTITKSDVITITVK